MLREEAARLLMMIQGAYPNYKPLDKSVAVNTWHLALSDISFDLAQQAFITYLRSDTSGFAPAPGQLIARVQELDRKSTRLNSSHTDSSRMPSSA